MGHCHICLEMIVRSHGTADLSGARSRERRRRNPCLHSGRAWIRVLAFVNAELDQGLHFRFLARKETLVTDMGRPREGRHRCRRTDPQVVPRYFQ